MSFSDACVYQERNEHDLMRDFKDEIDGYLENEKIIDICKSHKWESEDSIIKIYEILIQIQMF